jgi:hypothetical protein
LNVLLKSIPSIYALSPSALPATVDPFFAIIACLSLADIRPFSAFLFLGRPLASHLASDIQTLSQRIASTDSQVHIGLSTDDFGRASALCQSHFGAIFRFPSITPSLIRSLLTRSSYLSAQLIVPPCFRILSASQGSDVQSSSFLTRIGFERLVGGYVMFSVRPIQNPVVRVFERITISGSTFLSLHTLQNVRGFGDPALSRTLILKAYADSVLEALWGGSPFTIASQRKVTDEVRRVVDGSSLKSVGINDSLNTYRLYFVRHAIGAADLRPSISQFENITVLLDPPLVFVLSSTPVSIELWGWPIEIHCISNLQQFTELVHSAGLTFPTQE